MKMTAVAPAFAVLFVSALVVAQQEPDGLQFNVPYLCNNGKIYVVHRCEKNPKFEACFFQTGNDSEGYNTRAAVVYQMTKMCKVVQGSATPGATAAAQPPSDLNNSRWDCGAASVVTIFQCQKQHAQDYCFTRVEQNGKFLTQLPKPRNEIQEHLSSCKALPKFNPEYLAEFPNTYRVVQGMLAGNPHDNAVRAIGAFYQLSEIVKTLAGSRALTTDEQKFVGDYGRLQSELAQAAEKMFPGQHFDLAANPYRYSRTDPRFGFEGIPVWTTFLSPGIQDAFARMIGGNNDNYMMAVAQQKSRAQHQVENDRKVQEAEASYAKDAGSVAARHCLESGRSQTECLAEAFKVGMGELAGKDNILTKVMQDNKDPGLRLTGVYSTPGAAMMFLQDHVEFSCGGLLQDARRYSVEANGAQVRVTIGTQPKPLVLSFKDGKLVGPGPIDIAGRVQTGAPVASTQTTYDTQSHIATAPVHVDSLSGFNYDTDHVHPDGLGGYNVDAGGSYTTSTPIKTTHYEIPSEPKTVRCSIGVIPATGATPKISDAVTAVLGSEGSKSQNTTPGLRLNGTYAMSGGLSIDFRADSATLGCGEALSSEGYAVVPDNGQLVVKLQNSTGPLSLVLQPNGSLTGSGNVEVAGRIAIKGAKGVDYQPRNARCSVGTLSASK